MLADDRLIVVDTPRRYGMSAMGALAYAALGLAGPPARHPQPPAPARKRNPKAAAQAAQRRARKATRQNR